MKKADERLVGFDARKMWLDFNVLWDPKRRGSYLLREDASPVLSTDGLVWPSVFALQSLTGISENDFERLGYKGPLRPLSWIGPNNPLWEDLLILKDIVNKQGAHIQVPYWMVAITAFPISESKRHQYGPYFEKTNPSCVEDSWQFLGYDISDCSGLSGLCNCGYTSDEKTSFGDWAASLNTYHLFDSLDSAREFRDVSDKRVEEHAPFFVYGIYLIEKVSGGESGNRKPS